MVVRIVIKKTENINYKFNLPFNFLFKSSILNNGFSTPLNFALEHANYSNSDWLLILDENSILDKNYFKNYEDNFLKCTLNSYNVAMVSRISNNNLQISPSKVYYGGIHRPIKLFFTGEYEDEIFSIISGTSIKCSFINKINGFNEILWLDSLDRWLYTLIYANNKAVFTV